ncbi:uncharacterized protein K452DRAFT_284750 [Aplosporella prunicola CBS 121167]|uniref:Uncharacterized protein n=1 Tax=Aplosporella prunicola CBS 121167 TaxID=1176127 RepID=A0A6A6BJW8_9PEZI|nr:uncharacterized protein K452DRAFT_284750 [Aplosporella prunicola CBS 121167]KAF2144430.1 hypothetical protein K452DRAFT_284750 [Aplosporella prunicola CBS 121167]
MPSKLQLVGKACYSTTEPTQTFHIRTRKSQAQHHRISSLEPPKPTQHQPNRSPPCPSPDSSPTPSVPPTGQFPPKTRHHAATNATNATKRTYQRRSTSIAMRGQQLEPPGACHPYRLHMYIAPPTEPARAGPGCLARARGAGVLKGLLDAWGK